MPKLRNQPNVSFLIPKSYWTVVEVQGHLFHELLHGMRAYELRVAKRFKSPANREEHVVRQTEERFLALRSQIDEERRLGHL